MSDSNINVAVKMRPLIKREIDKKIPACWKRNGSMLVDTITGTNEFSFDLIFDENSSTSDLYDKVARPIVSTALAGVNGTVFAYGQTSSGKTHTMMGDENNDGLMLMAIKHIFNEVQSSNIEFVIRVGFIEIYNEKVYDLYDPDNVDLKMVEKNNDAYVNCKEAICKCVDDMYNVIKIGNKNKKIGDTDMNDRSSRSHTIFRISIESIDAVSEKAKISNLNLVDLAGSERASQTGATGARFVEGAHINKSLLSLSKVINKLINHENCHINYRDSKLTRYLQSSLGGNAMAGIICTICPTTLDETISTLYFAQRAMKVTNKPRVNEIISDATMIKQLHNQIKSLKVELEQAKNGANSAVPRIMQELSLHQGNILNYRKAENKSKLRRRTWTTFDNELAVISETKPLMLQTQQSSMTDLCSVDAVTPNLHMVTRDRGIGSMDYDPTGDFEKMTDEFDYKSKYHKLLQDFEELQEFTNWENELNIEPDAEAEYKAQISELQKELSDLKKERSLLKNELSMALQDKGSTEYLYEQHVKKAEQREKDLLEMCEDLKTGEMLKNALEEKNYMIQELQEQMKELSTANDALVRKIQEYGDVEQRVVKMEKVEVELEELKNTITVLTHTILTLENEKKEMSIRFNESMSASTLETTQTVLAVSSTPATNVMACVQTEEVTVSVSDGGTSSAEIGKLQMENDELSSKVMDLIEENDDLKQRAEELQEKLKELEALTEELRGKSEEATMALETLKSERVSFEERLKQNAMLIEELANEKNRLSDNCETQSEEVALAKSEKEWLEKQMKMAEEKIQTMEKELKDATQEVCNVEDHLKEAAEKLQNDWTQRLAEQQQSFDSIKANSEKNLEQLTQAIKMKEADIENKLLEQQESFDEVKMHLQRTVEELNEVISGKDREIEGKLAEQSKVFDESRVSLETRIQQLLSEIKTTVTDNETLLADQAKDFEAKKLELEQAIETLSRDLKLSVERLEETQKQLKTVSESASDAGQLQLERDCLRAELEKQTQNGHLMSQELSTLKKTLQEMEPVLQEKEDLVTILQNHKRLLAEKVQMIGELQEQLEGSAAYEKEILESNAANSTLQSELDQQREVIRVAQKEYSELRNEFDAVRGEMNELVESKSTVESSLAEQVRLLAAAEQEKEAMQSQLQLAQTALVEKESELEIFQEKVAESQVNSTSIRSEFNQRLEALERQCFSYKEEIREKDEKIEQHLLQMAGLESTAESKASELNEARKQLSILSAKNDDLEKILADTGSKAEMFESLRAKKEELITQVTTLTAQKDLADSQLTELAHQLRTMEEQKRELEKTVDSSVAEKEELKRELSDKAHKIASLEMVLETATTYERELATVTEAKAVLQKEFEDQLEKTHAVQKEKNDLRCQLESVHDSLAEKESELKRIQTEMMELTRDHRLRESVDSELKDRVVQLEQLVAQAKEEVQKKDGKIGEHLDQMRELERVLDTKSSHLTIAQKELSDVMSKCQEMERALVDAGMQKEEMYESFNSEKVKLLAQVAALQAEQSAATARFDQIGKQLRDMEEQKHDLSTKLEAANAKVEQLKRSLDKMTSKEAVAEEKFRDMQSKHEIVKMRVEQLDAELKQKDQKVDVQSQSEERKDEEVVQLLAQMKRLRSELNEAQAKKDPRKTRRSSTFDSNRHLIGAHMTLGTQTDPATQLCQCEALNEKVKQLKQDNMVKDLHMVQMREAEKSSPLLLENYALKKRVVAAKQAEAKHAKDMEALEQRLYQAVKEGKKCKVCDNRKGFSVYCQTMPDLNIEKMAEMKKELTFTMNKYEEIKRVSHLQGCKIAELEKEKVKRERDAENNPNQLNAAPQAECATLRQKYELVKSVVEKRYHRIVQMEKDMEVLRQQKTCTTCKSRLNTLQVP